MSNENDNIVRGTVIESLPNLMYRVQLDMKDEEGKSVELIAYLSGKMKFNRIRVFVGDQVDVLLDSYGGKGRVVKRH